MNVKAFLACFLLVEAAFLSPLFPSSKASAETLISQVIPDNSLESESSILVPNGREIDGLPADLIEGGALRGDQLFHSFSELNVGLNQQLYFSPVQTVDSIFSRVTGDTDSQILGTLGVIGDADFFLINPNGIFFGPSAQLDVNGSFFATTADTIEFGETFSFSARSQNAPPENLLAVNPSALFFNRSNPATITSQAQLSMNVGERFQLAGGDIRLGSQSADSENTSITVREGLIELSSLSTAGMIPISNDGLLAPASSGDRGNISIANTALVVRGAGNGDIRISADDITFQNSRLTAGHNDRRGPEAEAGDVFLEATGNISAAETTIDNTLTEGSRGSNGNITLIAAGNIRLDRSSVNSRLQGIGNNRDIEIRAGESLILETGQIQNRVEKTGQGNAGILTIEADALIMETPEGNPRDRQSLISVGTAGSGNGGIISIQTNRLTMIGPGVSGASGITSNSSRDNNQGNAGSIFINVNGPITMTRRGKIEAAIRGNNRTQSDGTVTANSRGNGGQIEINAQSLSLSNFSSIIAVSNRVVGVPGNIRLNIEEDLSLSNITSISAIVGPGTTASSVVAPENGNVVVNAGGNISFSQRSRIAVNTFEEGDAGDITITADSLSILDPTEEATTVGSSGLFSGNSPSSLGAGGNILLTVRELRVSGNSVINAETENSFSGGDISITADSVYLADGGQVVSSTFGTGDAGDVVINASERVVIEGNDPGFAAQRVRAEGFVARGGISDIRQELNREGENDTAPSGILVQSRGETPEAGNAGELTIEARQLTVEDGARVSTNTFGPGTGGELTLTLDRLFIREGAQVRAGSLRETGDGQLGAGGTLRATVAEIVDISGQGIAGSANVPSALLVNSQGAGAAGTIILREAQDSQLRLNIDDGGEISATSSGQGDAGDIFISLSDELHITDGNIRTDSSQSSGGSINIAAGNIFLAGDGDILTNVVSGEGEGGGIVISADALVALDDSDILAFAQDGAGGNITLPAFFGQNFEQSPPGSDPATLDGNSRVDVNATGQLASGTILFPDVSFIENSLSELPDAPIDTDTLVASSCIAAVTQGSGSLVITGTDSIPQQPGGTGVATVPTGAVRTLPEATAAATPALPDDWQIGDPIVEPQSLYQVGSDRLILSRDC